MDELKLLIDMVANLPTLAVWVLVGYLAYKIVVVGSVYGVIRFTVQKFVEWKTTKQVVEYKCGAVMINEDVAQALSVQIQRLNRGPYNYLHQAEVTKLKQAIDELERSETQKEKKS